MKAKLGSGEIYVIHEYGARRHFLALEQWAEDQKARHAPLRVRYVTLSVWKRIGKLILGKTRERWYSPGVDFLRLIYLSIVRGRTVVLSIAPASRWIALMNWLKKRHAVVYHTSWPHWQCQFVPHPPRRHAQWTAWTRFLGDGQIVAAVTQAAARSVQQFGARALVVYHSVDTDDFRPLLERIPATDVVRIICVGRLTERKGVLDALEMAARTREKAVWEFAGSGPLEARVRSAGENVRFLGYVSGRRDLIRLYQYAEILVLPIRRRGIREALFGIALIEAMACGVVPVASDHVGTREIIEDGKTGFLVPEGRLDVLYDRIDLLLTDRDLRQHMAQRARLAAVERYDSRVLARRWGEALTLARGTTRHVGECAER